MSPEAVEPLMAATNEAERGWVETALPETTPAPVLSAWFNGPEPDEVVPQLRPSLRRVSP